MEPGGGRSEYDRPHGGVTWRSWAALAVVAGGLFLAVVTTTVVSVALPIIGRELGASATDQQWIVDSYVLVYASLLVVGGAVGDRYGRKGLFMLGSTIFGLGSLLTGLAPTVPVLLAGRVLQGLGPALLVPGSLTIVRAVFHDPRTRATAIGLWSTASGLALAVGPVLGGVLVAGLGWRSVFLVNVPLATALVGLAAVVVPRLPRSVGRHRLDVVGAILTTVAVAGLSFGSIEGQSMGWTAPLVLTAFAVGVVVLVGFVAWERFVPGPLVDVSLFRRPAFTAANLAGLVVFFAFVGAIVYFSAFFQDVQGHSAVRAGLDVSAIGVAFALASPVSGRLVGRLGPEIPLVAGLVIAGAATLGLLRLTPQTGSGAIWWNFAVLGFGVGLCLTPMTSTAVSVVDGARAGMASAVHNALRQVGQIFGVAVLGALVYGGRSESEHTGVLAGPEAEAFVGGLHAALWASGLALFAAAIIVALLLAVDRPPDSRAEPPERLRGDGRSWSTMR